MQAAGHVRAGLRLPASEHAGSSQPPRRALLLPDAPNAAAGEVTDKGCVNQGRVLARRAEEAETLYAATRDARVVTAE